MTLLTDIWPYLTGLAVRQSTISDITRLIAYYMRVIHWLVVFPAI